MAKDILIIDGVDFSAHLPWQAIQWQHNDLDSEDSGRNTRDGLMYRAIITKKVKLEVKMNPMNSEQIKLLLNTLSGKTYLTVTYLDPQKGKVTKTFYNSSRQATLRQIREQKGPQWEDIGFSLTER